MKDSKLNTLKKTVSERACLKQDVYAVTQRSFGLLKTELSAIASELKEYIGHKDDRVLVEYKTNSAFECQITLGGDTLIFHMHTNVFYFPHEHIIMKSPYVRKDINRAYCGIINIYNFLSDSFNFQRLNDSGYLVGRIFVNHDSHFFVEGRKQLGYLFNDFSGSILDAATTRSICEVALQCAIEFDLYTPPFQTVREVTVDQFQTLSQDLKLKTGKRMGFRFQYEPSNPKY